MNEGNEPYEFSPSQVETFLACKRKWAWRKIAKQREPEKDSAKLGTEVHLQLENHLSGKPLDFTRSDGAGYIAAAGIHLIPDPDMSGKTEEEIAHLAATVQIENEFRFTSPVTGFVWNGRIDLQGEDSRVIPNLLEELIDAGEDTYNQIPFVLDHKSTSGMRWAKTPDDLLWDVQANVYAYVEMKRLRKPRIDLTWVYYQTRGARSAKRVHLRMYSHHAAKNFERIERIATEMAGYLDRAPGHEDGPPDLREYVQTIPPNPNACDAFGGCPYEHMCRLSMAERLKASMSNDQTLDSLRARAAAEDGKPVQSDRDVPAPSALPDWLTAPKDPGPAISQPAVAPAPAPTADSVLDWLNSSPAPAATPAPAAPLAPLPPEVAPSPTLPAPDTRQDAPVDINPPESKLPAPTLPPVVAPAPAAAEEPKVKRTRKKKDTEVPAAAPPMQTSIVTYAPQDQEAAQAMVEGAREPGDDAGFTLYIDCAPQCAYAPAEAYIARAKSVIAAKDWPDGKGGTMKVADYRYLPFGQGAGALSGAVLAEVMKDPPSHLVLSSRTPEGAVVANDLAAHASFVVRGAA